MLEPLAEELELDGGGWWQDLAGVGSAYFGAQSLITDYGPSAQSTYGALSLGLGILALF